MNIRKWFFLFWSCMAVGAGATALTGSIMLWTDQSFHIMGIDAVGFNAGMMLLVGTMIGAFSQMGFFAYLTLNYIALSIFRRKYLWNALQAYTTLFAVAFFGYVLYDNREVFGNMMFWLLPLLLAVCSWIVAKVKVNQTNASALVPTLFLMYVGTLIETWPSLSAEETNASAVIFMLVPLFVCNAYQILMLHRILKPAAADSAINTKPVA
ncbi:KinB-signaling pathway activation protein [Paenibacillus tarimensis]|uniref:KinB-signaling pathway activation protein n=1 Tax=Paenibacillus tarimensis TaxID=416012 RepID=UPI001F1BCECD|nr:KinB-signaling pathway activation protein [Paenibacillus tarimensis]MCF2946099.1 KinB-signaling pathway activation protein [Paenibacillus tarimensis]